MALPRVPIDLRAGVALLRCLEALAALALLSHLPSSGDLLRRASAAVASPRFAFLVGNAIVLLLFRCPPESPPAAADDVSGEFAVDCRHVPVNEAVEGEETADVAQDEEEGDVGVAEEGDEEEFRRTVEAFIERQLKFHRQESLELSSSARAPERSLT